MTISPPNSKAAPVDDEERATRSRQWRTARIQQFAEAQRRKRQWISFEEIADWCSELNGSGVPNEVARQHAYTNLERDLLNGDFEENGRSRVLYLHTSPKTRMTREWLHNAIEYNYDNHNGRAQFLPHCWLPRDMFEWWAAKHHLPSSPARFRLVLLAAKETIEQVEPADDRIVGAAHLPGLSSDAQPPPQSAQKRVTSKSAARDFAKNYIEDSTAKGGRPTQKGLIEAAQAAGLRGGRNFLRESIREILGAEAISRGRPQKRNSPK